MNSETDNPIVTDAEATLRQIAALPAPAGLEDRIHASLASAQRRKTGRVLTGRVLQWPAAGGSGNAWLRSAAAAAIALVIVGGGRGVYSRVHPWQPARAIALPGQGGAQGGFGNAGAIRTPQTLNGPVLTHSGKAQAAVPATTKKKSDAEKKSTAQPLASH
jgi:hypothetical protein